MAEQSFEVPMPNSPLLLNYLGIGASFLQESRLTTVESILAFWLRSVMLPRLKKWFLFISRKKFIIVIAGSVFINGHYWNDDIMSHGDEITKDLHGTQIGMMNLHHVGNIWKYFANEEEYRM